MYVTPASKISPPKEAARLSVEHIGNVGETAVADQQVYVRPYAYIDGIVSERETGTEFCVQLQVIPAFRVGQAFLLLSMAVEEIQFPVVSAHPEVFEFGGKIEIFSLQVVCGSREVEGHDAVVHDVVFEVGCHGRDRGSHSYAHCGLGKDGDAANE